MLLLLPIFVHQRSAEILEKKNPFANYKT